MMIGNIATYLICFGLVAVITATMFYFNSTVDWDYNDPKDQVLVVVTNVSAIALACVLVYTAVRPDDNSN